MFFSCCLDNPIPFPVALNPLWSMLKLWLVFSEKDNFLITEQFSSRLSIQMHVLFLIHFIKIIVFHSSANFTCTSDMNFVCYCNEKENIPFPTQDFIGVPVNFSGWWELVLHMMYSSQHLQSICCCHFNAFTLHSCTNTNNESIRVPKPVSYRYIYDDDTRRTFL